MYYCLIYSVQFRQVWPLSGKGHTEATAVPPLLPISNRAFLRLFLMQLKFIHDPVLLPFRCDSLLSRVSLISNHFSVCVCARMCRRRCWSRARLACRSLSSSSSSSSKPSSWKTRTPKCCWASASTSCWPLSPSSWCACPLRPSSPPRCCAVASTWRSPAWACPC